MLAACPNKRVRLAILVVDILVSYRMLLSRTFCKDLRGEIKMDWSEAIIPLGNQKIKLEPEPKNKYTVFPLDNPKAQILFQECEFGNYLVLALGEKKTDEAVDELDGLWQMEFDGSCANSGLGAGVVLLSPTGNIFPFSFKLDFKNTNNIAEYEALLLGLSEAKCKGIKLLKVKGDAELIVRQVRNVYTVKNDRLRHYRNRVWDEL